MEVKKRTLRMREVAAEAQQQVQKRRHAKKVTKKSSITGSIRSRLSFQKPAGTEMIQLRASQQMFDESNLQSNSDAKSVTDGVTAGKCYGDELDRALMRKSIKPPANDNGAAWWSGGSGATGRDNADEEALKGLWFELFEALDTDGSGTVDKEELEDAAQEGFRTLAALLKESDTDGDGEVSRAEWEAMLQTMLTDHGFPGPGAIEHLRGFLPSSAN